ncbi:MAG TPA: c-type cytochrome [Bryobacteraceae bacterium]|nr:c-type cytochrome [Bryobacteraceae bacterium]
MKTYLSWVILAAVFVTAQFAQERRSTRDGVYTEAQASRGQGAYKKSCGTCHGETLMGSGAAIPPLAGSDFTDQWAGQTADDLFERMQTTMPGDHPGTLARATNADILAYILQVNKLPAGKHELPTDADALKQIQFEAAQ